MCDRQESVCRIYIIRLSTCTYLSWATLQGCPKSTCLEWRWRVAFACLEWHSRVVHTYLSWVTLQGCLYLLVLSDTGGLSISTCLEWHWRVVYSYLSWVTLEGCPYLLVLSDTAGSPIPACRESYCRVVYTCLSRMTIWRCPCIYTAIRLVPILIDTVTLSVCHLLVSSESDRKCCRCQTSHYTQSNATITPVWIMKLPS